MVPGFPHAARARAPKPGARRRRRLIGGRSRAVNRATPTIARRQFNAALSRDSERKVTTCFAPCELFRRFWPLVLLLAAIAAAWAGGLTQQISWAALARNQAALAAWVASHPVAAPLLYVVIYAVAVAAVPAGGGGAHRGRRVCCSAPCSAAFSLSWDRSVGAIVLFLAVRYHLADAIAARRGRFLDAVRPGLRARRLQLSAGAFGWCPPSPSGW